MTALKPTAVALATAFVFLPAAVQAQAPSKAQQDAIRANCRSDYMKNCSSVTPGGREALECLMQNKTKVSAGCQGALNAVSTPAPTAAKPEPKSEPKVEPVSPAPAPAAAAPHSPEAPKAAAPTAAKPTAPKAAKAPTRPAAPAEAAAPAPGTAPGLAAAPPPGNAAPAPQRPMKLGEALMIRRFCATDFKVLCKGVPIGQGRAVQCLADNRPSLSPGCKQAMADTGH